MKIAYRRTRRATLALLALLATGHANAEDGYDLWLRYHPVADEAARAHYRAAASEIVAAASAGATSGQAAATLPSTLGVAQAELMRGLSGLLGTPEPVSATPTQNGSIVFGTPPAILLNGVHWQTAPTVRIHGLDNLIMMSGQLVGARAVVDYTTDLQGTVKEIWILSALEQSVLWPVTPADAAAWTFDPIAQTWTKP